MNRENLKDTTDTDEYDNLGDPYLIEESDDSRSVLMHGDGYSPEREDIYDNHLPDKIGKAAVKKTFKRERRSYID